MPATKSTSPALRIACPVFGCNAAPGERCTKLAEHTGGRYPLPVGHKRRREEELRTRRLSAQLVLRWEKRGRSMVAVAGRLALQVSIAPPAYLGQERRWRIRQIFGAHFLDPGAPSKSYPSFETAAVQAERFARDALCTARLALQCGSNARKAPQRS